MHLTVHVLRTAIDLHRDLHHLTEPNSQKHTQTIRLLIQLGMYYNYC
jgi:hypothetical protein